MKSKPQGNRFLHPTNTIKNFLGVFHVGFKKKKKVPERFGNRPSPKTGGCHPAETSVVETAVSKLVRNELILLSSGFINQAR